MNQSIITFYLKPADLERLTEIARESHITHDSPHLCAKSIVQNYLDNPKPLATSPAEITAYLDKVGRVAWLVHRMARSRQALELTTELVNLLGNRPKIEAAVIADPEARVP